METIKSLGNISFEVVYEAFKEAFSNYEVQVNREELQTMLTRRGFIPELSFGAFYDEQLVAFTLNGIGLYNGTKTAYDTGTGTLKEFRGKGIASRIFEYSLPFLRDADVKQYLLEVLQHNVNAISVYKKLGFEVSREFNYFSQLQQDIELLPKRLPEHYQFREINLSENEFMSFWDFTPSWQNSFESVLRTRNDFIILGVLENERLIGYCIFEPGSGDVTQLAVAKECRRKGVATALLREVLKHNRHKAVKIVNTETECEEIYSFLLSNGISLRGKQFEMIREL